jgi:hypothetical protein
MVARVAPIVWSRERPDTTFQIGATVVAPHKFARREKPAPLKIKGCGTSGLVTSPQLLRLRWYTPLTLWLQDKMRKFCVPPALVVVCGLLPLGAYQSLAVSQQPRGVNVRFRLVLSGKLKVKDADTAGFDLYKTEQGTSLQRRTEVYHSASQAKDKMNAMFDGAERLVQRGPKLDKAGLPVGERILFISKQSQATVSWTEGKTLYVIESSNLSDVLDFENQLVQAGNP